MKFIWKSDGKQNAPRFIHGVIENTIDDSNLEVNQSGKFLSAALVMTHADCLNANNSGKDLIIWINNDFKKLKALAPKKQDYGWVLATLSISVFVKVNDVTDLDQLADIEYDGIYSENLELLTNIKNRIE